MKTIVINNEERFHTMRVPTPDGIKGPDGLPADGPMLVLAPGVNFVDAVELKSCRTNKQFAALFSTKIARHAAKECVSERVGQPMLVQGRDVADAAPLSSLALDEAIAIVEDTCTADALAGLLRTEDRAEVRRALNARIELLESPPDEGEEGTQFGRMHQR